MNKKMIRNKFTTETDEEFLAISKALSDKDFSESSNKNAVFSRIIKNMDKDKERRNMKKSMGIKHFTVAAALALCIISGSIYQVSAAKDFVQKVLNTISLGHITVNQMEDVKGEIYPVPESLKGKIFDEDGNELKTFSSDYDGKYYTADGKEISSFSISDGEIITIAQQEKMDEGKNLIVKDSSELNQYTCFNVILPSYLPEDFEFDRAEFYKDEKGAVENSKYINLYFINTKTQKLLFMQQRYADEETAYEMSTDGEIEKIKINNVDAVLIDQGKSIEWEANGVLYSFFGKGEITKDDLIKTAESIK